MKWNKISKSVNSKETTITYECDALRGITIESRKRHIPHANRAGTWDHTSYFVMKGGEDLCEKWSLADAKEWAENYIRETEGGQ